MLRHPGDERVLLWERYPARTHGGHPPIPLGVGGTKPLLGPPRARTAPARKRRRKTPLEIL